MVRPSRVRAIWRKELRETLRDRKTLLLMVLLPVVLYPLLLVLLLQVASAQVSSLEEETARVAVDEALASHPLVLALEAEATELGIQTLYRQSREETLAELRRRQVEVALLLPAEGSPDDAASGPERPAHAPAPEQRYGPSNLALELHFLSVSERSRVGVDRVEGLLAAWTEEETLRRLEALGVGGDLLDAVTTSYMDAAETRQRGGYLLGALLPLLMIVTVLVGATYPAIDLTAGERERGSIQTLFTAPISTVEIVAGKYLTVLCIALISGLANLISMALVFGQASLLGLGDVLDAFDFSLSLELILLLFLAILQVALFVSAALLGAAVLAKSYKEAQSATLPVYLLCLLPGTFAQLPGVELSLSNVWIPAVNVVLLTKHALVEGVPWGMTALVTGVNLLFAAAAVSLTARIFSREGLVVGELAPLPLWGKHRRPAPHAGAGEALGWVAVLFVLFFYVGSLLQQAHLLVGVVLTLWLVLLLPTLGVARLWKLDFRSTFLLYRAPGRVWAAALLIGLSAWVPVAWITELLTDFGLPTNPEDEAMLMELLRPTDAWWGPAFVLFAVALTPAICEEAIFRGFLFTGLRTRLGAASLVFVTALIFGLFHLSLARIVGTTLLGVALGWLVLRGGSLWPAVLAHALNNTVAISGAWLLGDTDAESLPWAWLLPAAFAACGLAMWLVRDVGARPSPSEGPSGPRPPAAQDPKVDRDPGAA